MHDDNVPKTVESERVPSESHLSDMDSNERDDVPLARLLKHGLTRKSSHPSANDPIAIDAPCSSDPSVHSSSSSSLNVFISTPRQSLTNNEKHFPVQTDHSSAGSNSLTFLKNLFLKLNLSVNLLMCILKISSLMLIIHLLIIILMLVFLLLSQTYLLQTLNKSPRNLKRDLV